MLRKAAHVFSILIGFAILLKGTQIEVEGNSALVIGMVIAGAATLLGNFVWMAGSVKRWRL